MKPTVICISDTGLFRNFLQKKFTLFRHMPLPAAVASPILDSAKKFGEQDGKIKLLEMDHKMMLAKITKLEKSDKEV